MGDHTFLPLLLIVGLAFMVPLLVSRLRWFRAPAVVVEILCGIAVGKSGLALVEPEPALEFLSLLGFVYLMFLSGLEIDFRGLRFRRGGTWGIRSPMVQALLLFACGVVLAVGCAYSMALLGLMERDSVVLMSLILGTTSVGVVVPTLKSQGEIGRPLGQVVLLSAIVADVGTILLLTAALFWLGGRGVADLVMLAAMTGVVVLSVKLGAVLSRRGVLARLFEGLMGSSVQIKVRGSLALLLIFIVLAEVIGAEVVLGAFVAGALVSIFSPREHNILIHKLEALGYGFFVPVFFIMVGISFDVSVLSGGLHTAALLGTLLAAATVVKIMPAVVVLGPVFGVRHSFAVGTLLSARLTLIIAVSAVGLRVGLVTEEINSAVVLLALVTCVLAPAVYMRLSPRRARSGMRVVIAGLGRVGRELARRLTAQKVPVVAIEKDPDQAAKVTCQGVQLHVGDATDPELLRALELTADDVFVAVTGNDNTNLEACLTVRAVSAVGKVVARDENPDSTMRFAQRGVIPLNRTGALAITLENIILRPDLVHLLIHETPEHEAYELAIRMLPQGVRRVRDLPRLEKTRLVLVRRGDEILVPAGDTELRVGDRLVAFGTESDREKLHSLLVSED